MYAALLFIFLLMMFNQKLPTLNGFVTSQVCECVCVCYENMRNISDVIDKNFYIFNM